jgi:VanZ family protein
VSERAARGAWWAVGVWAAIELTLTSIPGYAIPRVGFDADDLAHVAMFGVLGVLVARALARSGYGAAALWSAWPVLAAYGALDEWHQRFIPGRFPSVTDAIADAAGSAAGLALGWYLLRTRWAAWIR